MVRKEGGGVGSFLAGSLAWGVCGLGDRRGSRLSGPEYLLPVASIIVPLGGDVIAGPLGFQLPRQQASADQAAIPDTNSNTLVLPCCDHQEPSPTSTWRQQPNQDRVRRKTNKKNLPIRGVHFADMEAGTLSWVQETVKRKGAREKSAPWVCSRVFKFEMGDHCVLVFWWFGDGVAGRFENAAGPR